MLELIHRALPTWDPCLPEIWVRADRITLAKRLWRAVADDGKEFGFELTTPLKPGEVLSQSAEARYVVWQAPEPLLEISLEIAPSAAAGIGWAIGNLHLELSADAARMLAVDEPSVRQLLTRLSVPFRATTAVFRPGRFARNQQLPHELGPSHQH